MHQVDAPSHLEMIHDPRLMVMVMMILWMAY
jgi:hypothetical protein